jgi:hypothetical protein
VRLALRRQTHGEPDAHACHRAPRMKCGWTAARHQRDRCARTSPRAADEVRLCCGAELAGARCARTSRYPRAPTTWSDDGDLEV